MTGLGIDGHWIGIHDADPRVVTLYRRHYSANLKKDHSHGVGGQGAKLVLITPECDALFIWVTHPAILPIPVNPDSRSLKTQKRRDVGGIQAKKHSLQDGILCSVFRNEGHILSSELILEAEELAWQRWPGLRLFTYVWDSKVESVNPGYCFKVAGWKTCGRNADGRLTILEKLPE